MTATIGYARTSTTDQDAGLEAQIADLKAAGCTEVYSEQVSSLSASRPQLAEALRFLRKGDTFIVTKPDRLARSTRDLLDIVDRLMQRGVNVRVLSMNIDTGSATGALMLTILGGVAQFERALMLERQRDGIRKAQADGRYRGRRPTAPAKVAEIRKLKAEGLGVTEISRRTGVNRTTIYQILAAA